MTSLNRSDEFGRTKRSLRRASAIKRKGKKKMTVEAMKELIREMPDEMHVIIREKHGRKFTVNAADYVREYDSEGVAVSSRLELIEGGTST